MKKRIGATVIAAVALTAGVAMAIETGGRPWSLIAAGFGARDRGELHKVCDQGRVIYVLSEIDFASIAVVPNAPECQFGR